MKRTNIKHNERTQALKNILKNEDREGASKANAEEFDSLLDLKEDSIESGIEMEACDAHIKTVTFGTKKPNSSDNPSTPLTHSIELFHHLIDKELVKAANFLDIEKQELKAWVDLQIEVPAKTILALLRTMQSLHLDPLNEEIGFAQFEDGHWQVLITIEGCSHLLNNHSQFNGLTFTQSDTLVDGVPEWIECAIYRRDRILPITVREHFIEVRGNGDIWQKMPRRMLRHKALQQCVRLAF